MENRGNGVRKLLRISTGDYDKTSRLQLENEK